MNADQCATCAIAWRVVWYDLGAMRKHKQETQSLETSIFASRSIDNSFVEVYSPSLDRWLRLEEIR